MHRKLILLTLYVINTLGLINCDLDDRHSDEVQAPALTKLIRMRCTRRFSPGVCVDEVAPVWTFVFLAQNCTERLGCPNNYRTNRFRSYRMCMKRCRTLVDIYLKMVEYTERNSTSSKNDTVTDAGDKNDTDDINLREGWAKYHVTASGSQDITVNLEDLSQDLEEEGYKEDQQENRFIVYKDTNTNEDIMPPDVDYVPGEIRSEFDLLHW